MSISETDTVYIFLPDSETTSVIGSGFSSEEEIEQYINTHFQKSGTYKYGILSDVHGSIRIPEPPSKKELLQESTIEKINTVVSLADNDDRVESAVTLIEDQKHPIHAIINSQNVRYSDQVDFSVEIRPSVFDSVPLSKSDSEDESRVSELFYDIVGTDMIFMGYDTGYKKRGRKDPFVSVFGRVQRNTPQSNMIQSISKENFIKNVIWSGQNTGTVKQEYTDNYNGESDTVVCVFTESVDIKSFDFTQQQETQVKELLAKLESGYDITVVWYGYILIEDTTYLCVGIEYIPYQNTPV